MNITFLGAAKTVTGSCYLVETASCRFLVDCGMYQGRSKEIALNEEPFPFNPAELDFILLTHAHIDHSGRIPKIYIDGFKNRIITTKATAELCSIMLPDSGHIQEFENEWTNRKRKRAGKPPVQPLYTHQDAIDCLKLFQGVKYGELISPANGIKVRFNDAGHILGSSILELWVTENGKETKVVFSGDLGNKDIPILRDPAIIESADCLVIESTYGNRLHADRYDKTERFLEIICDTIDRGGNIVIPSFAVGRTQEIIYDLNKHYEKQDSKLAKLFNTPVYIDSPLAVSATEIFRKNLDCYDEEAKAYITNGDNPLDFPGLQFTRSAEESKMLNDKAGSKIIISASGMCDAGRIKHHLKHNLWRKESSIVFVGYQAEGTLGRRIVDGARQVRIFGEEITINARIEVIEGYSGHADRNGLLEWMEAFRKKPAEIFVVHGEEAAGRELANHIAERFRIEAIIPSRGNSYAIGTRGAPAAVREMPASRYRYMRLEMLDYLEKLKEELEDLSDAIHSELKQEKDDREVLALAEKLKSIEKSMVEALK